MKESDRALAAAVSNIRREAQAELGGDTYYMVAQKLTELREIILNGCGDDVYRNEDFRPRLVGLSPALSSLRTKIETELRDNRYYLATHKLDVLAFIVKLGGAASRPAEPLLNLAAAPQTRTANAA